MGLTAAAYWGPRKESSEDCARRAVLFFGLLAKSSPLFVDWFERAWSKMLATTPIEISEADIVKRFEKSNLSHKNKMNEERRPGLGFSLGAWNGRVDEREAGGIMIGCGRFSKYLNNAVVLDLPTSFTESPDIAIKNSHILQALVESWEPDWAAVYDVNNKKGHEPFLDRALYVASAAMIPRELGAGEGIIREPFETGILFLKQ
jgi:hypothetical protein